MKELIMKKSLILLICLFTAHVHVWGATYTMRADGTSATKGTTACGNGTASDFMGITRHNQESFSPGDIIELCDDGGSIYTGRLIVRSDGSAGGGYITYRAESGTTITVDAGGATAEAFRMPGRQYIRVENLNFTGGTGAGVYGATQAGRDIAYIVLDNIRSYSHDGPGVQFISRMQNPAEKVSQITIQDSQIDTNGAAGISLTGFWLIEYVTIDGNDVFGNNTSQNSRQGIGIAVPRNVLTTGWTYENEGDDYYQAVTYTPLRVFQDDANFRELTKGNIPLTDGQWDYQGGNLYVDIGGNPEGIDIAYLTGKITNIAAINNKSYSNTDHSSGWDGVGIFFDLGVEDSYAAFNQVYDNDGGGIYVKSSKNIDIYYNLIYNNSVGQGDGIRVRKGSYDVNIFNNTITGTINGNGILILDGSDLIVLKNNIISNNNAYGISSDGTSANVSEDYNQLYNNTSGDRQNISAGSNSQSGDPLFVDTANENYTLEPISPAIDAGELQFMHAAGWHDNPYCKPGYTVKTRLYGDGPDIGACENNIDCAGDFNEDGDIDGSDLAELVNDVNLLDLGIFASNFGKPDCNAF